jgi:hypothetical protein
MANALKYAVNYGKALEQMYPYKLYFGALYNTPNNGRFRWAGSKTIEIPSIATTGRTNASRDSIGTAQRNYDNDWEPKTLTNQRKWSTLVHPKDIDQTNWVATIANITKVFNEEQKFPEMDAYTISKLYADWVAQSMTADTVAPTAANILDKFDNMMLAMDNARVPISGRILYVTNEVKKMLKNAAGLTRNWSVQSSYAGINREVDALDGVPVIPVPAELMKTAYDFSEGWEPAVGASQINMAMIHPGVVITPVSYQFADLDEPTAITEGKYYYYEESFEDVFILNKKKAGLQFNVTT